ncbi:Succinate--CoA ligase [ADP-forming] subunit beta, mitochondrial [Vanrija pseudolonga]|uniref:Succinate--CoA ligase [ADP-forming] subunit beta, mitochondrial n=1 Tax=Vanrija pseudolonga TaxID=143232 RepID=A0AAF0Y5I4_9TREE|nr:Succinate--CoA ligase [ADP-forming] subunit beta, mitochondrial [Vanrija pseudolonga]
MLRSLRATRAIKRSAFQQQQVRNLSIHEYQSVQLLNQYGVDTPVGKPAFTPAEAESVAAAFGKPTVIKAQVLAGGRGKGHFDNGFQGGVHMVDTPAEAKDFASKMLGHKLITKQTGAGGRICNAVMLAERMPPAKEYYAAILNDRAAGTPVLVTSNQGGMNIEDVAHDTPEAIVTTPLDFENGISHADGVKLAEKLGFAPNARDNAADTFSKLYQIFKDKDSTQIEINPLGELPDGRVLCMDAKFGFDDNADFRQKDVFALRDTTQEDPQEVQAAEYGLNFIKLDGDIGCLVNGAGLAMATMDVLALHGGSPANFLDVGGGATAEAVKAAFKLILSEKKVKSIFVNIFGGIMRCDVIADGIIQATHELNLSVPLIVRLQGTKEAEAKKMIKESGLKIYAYDDLDEAAAEAVKLAK